MKPGKQGALLEERAELRVRGDRFGQQETFALLGVPLAGHVAHDLRSANDVAIAVFDRRDGQRHEDASSVGTTSLGVKMVDAVSRFQPGDDLIFLGQTFWWISERKYGGRIACVGE